MALQQRGPLVIFNSESLLRAAPIKNMHQSKQQHSSGTSYGLSEAGYDLQLKQDIRIVPRADGTCVISVLEPNKSKAKLSNGRFVLASAIEEFDMPPNLVGVVHDKSTWVRKGLSVFNTVIEPGWKGFLTLELVYHGSEDLHIPAGSGIAQVLFHQTVHASSYDGKYQNQADQPVDSIFNQGPVLIMDAKGVYPSNLDVAVQQQCRHVWEYSPYHGTTVCKKCGFESP
jgi:dCTP deaminase